jgi:uncharacterized protein DUF3592
MSPQPLSSRSSRASNAPPGCMVLFFLVFFVAGAAVLWFLTLRPVSRVVAAQMWPAVPCLVVESHVDESSDSDGTTYKAVIHTSYTYEGRQYTSNRYDFVDVYSSGYDGKKAVVDQYPAGAQTTCYVNPADPSEAVLKRGFSARYLVGLVGLIFLLPGLIGMIWVVSAGRKRKAPSLLVDAASPFGVTDPQGEASAAGPVELRPQAGPVGKLFGMIFVSLFWNGIVWTIGWFAILGQPEKRPEGCAIAFLSIFALIGLLLIYGTFRQLLILFNPRPKLTLSPGSPSIGGTTYLQWRLSGGTGGVQHLKITLEGREEAQYRRGTNTATDKEIFAVIPLVDATDSYQMASGSTSFVVPADTMPSFRSDHNKIVWTIKAQLEIANWPDSDEEFEVLVRPGR